MPDIATHYAFGLLAASRVERSWVKAALLALVALTPDIDVLLRIHRWFTHSFAIAFTIFGVVTLTLLYVGREGLLRYVAVAALLYVLHIALDTFTAPTPVLWPLTNQAYMLNAELNGVVAEDGVRIAPTISVSSKAADFTQQPLIEGPIISPQGIITAIGVATILLVEWFVRRQRYERG